MDCNWAGGNLDAYLLGALDASDRQLMGEHLQGCRSCSLLVQEDGETMARFALTAPRLAAPARVKERLLARVDADLRAYKAAQLRKAALGYLVELGRTFRAYSARIGAAVLVVGLIFGGFLFNDQMEQLAKYNQKLNERLDAVSERNDELAGLLDGMAARESQVVQMVKDQRYFTYEAIRLSIAPGTTVNMLWGTGWTSDARGMIVYSRYGTYGLLLAYNLPPLTDEQVYQVWLVRDGVRFGAGQFTVDSTGFGYVVIIPTIPFAESEGVGITIQPIEGSADPTGTNVLKGDL